MPTRSAIHPLAEDCFEHLEDPCALLALIERFDQLIREDSSGGFQPKPDAHRTWL